MIPFDEIDVRLAALGKDRAWLAEASGRKINSIRVALAPKADPKNRSEILQRALSDAIEREEEARQSPGLSRPEIHGVYEVHQTADEADLVDRASRAVGAESLADFCHRAILFRAQEIMNHRGDPVKRPNLALVAEESPSYPSYVLPFLGAVAAGEPVEAPRDEEVTVAKKFPAGHFVVEVNGRSMEPDFPDGSRWVIDGRDKFSPKNGAVCVVSDGSGSYLKRWNARRKVFESINPDFRDVIPADEAKLQGYPVERIS